MAITVKYQYRGIKCPETLSSSTSDLRQSFERLSSGLRIVRARDDAAGMAIADALRADSRIASVAIRNANDGISLVSIADGALDQMANVLTRMAELAEQAANGTLGAPQRSALGQEFSNLASEIQRIAETTKFNDLLLLSGGANVSLQVGLDSSANSQIAFEGVDGTLEAIGLAQTGSKSLIFSLNDTTTSTAQAAARSALDAVKLAISSLTTSRGSLGAAESRLNVAITNLSVARENFRAAESQIRDVDVAEEAANLTRLNILQQGRCCGLSSG
jgi:flagellin